MDTQDQPTKLKTSFSVPEMCSILGISKVEGYWLVKKNLFETILIGGKLRVMRGSFEAWYAGQLHYKKVSGEAPGSKWEQTTWSLEDTAALLGVTQNTVYEILKKNPISTCKVGSALRINKKDFEQWYHSQNSYLTVTDKKSYSEQYKDSFTLPEITHMLGVHRNTVYFLVQTGKLQTFDTGREKRVSKDSFKQWYQSQEKYKLVGDDSNGIDC